MTDRDPDRKTLPELITKLDAGEFELYSFVANRCYLDGGSMFGVIPKVLWSKLIPCDENNLVPLDTNPLFVKAHGKRILVECGIGDMLTDTERKVYACYTPSRLDDCLSRLGVTPDMNGPCRRSVRGRSGRESIAKIHKRAARNKTGRVG